MTEPNGTAQSRTDVRRACESRAGPGQGPRPLSARRLAGIAVVAALVHGAFDAITYSIPLLAPSYLRLWDGPQEFQTLSPVAISIAVSCVSGVIAVIATLAVQPRQRQPAILAIVVTGFWMFSVLLLRVVWLSTPWGITVLSAAAGVPRGAAIGWLASRLSGP